MLGRRQLWAVDHLWPSILIRMDTDVVLFRPAYAPQLGSQLRITHAQLNIIGGAGNGKITLSSCSVVLTPFSRWQYQRSCCGTNRWLPRYPNPVCVRISFPSWRILWNTIYLWQGNSRGRYVSFHVQLLPLNLVWVHDWRWQQLWYHECT